MPGTVDTPPSKMRVPYAWAVPQGSSNRTGCTRSTLRWRGRGPTQAPQHPEHQCGAHDQCDVGEVEGGPTTGVSVAHHDEVHHARTKPLTDDEELAEQAIVKVSEGAAPDEPDADEGGGHGRRQEPREAHRREEHDGA